MKIIAFALTYLSLTTMVYAANQIYAVQVSIARQYENAVYDYQKLGNYQNVRIEKINDAYFVCIGAYPTKTKASLLFKKLKITYPDALLVKYIIDKQRIVQSNHPAYLRKAKKIPSLPSRRLMANDPEIPAHSPTNIPISNAGKIHDSPNPPEEAKQSSDTPKQLSEITKKLPEIQNQSTGIKEDLLNAGMQSYHKGKHEVTVSSLSKYASIAPKDQQRPSTLLIIGKSLEQMNRLKSALDIYGRIIEQYPDSPEALFSIIAMADIGVNNPGLHFPISKKGAEYVRDPVSAYDAALLKNVPLSILEHIQYQKGRSLWKLKRYEKAREAQVVFLKQFPNSAYRKEVILMLKDSMAVLINQYNGSGDHISVANLFFQGWINGLMIIEDADTLLKSSSSLSFLGLYDDSLTILNTLKKSAIGKTSSDIDKAVADTEKKKTIGLMQQMPSDPKWNKFQTGREYISANNITMAEQAFSDLKTSDADQFWSKITDYALEENMWTRKYRTPFEK